MNFFCFSLSECYFAGKGTALVLPDADATAQYQQNVVDGAGITTVENGIAAAPPVSGGAVQGSSAIQRHLQSMFYLLRPEETLKMVSYGFFFCDWSHKTDFS